MKKIFLIGCLICFISPSILYAQARVEKGFELSEILKIMEMYRMAPNLSFNFEYTYSDSTPSSPVLEDGISSAKFSDGRYYILAGGTELIQGYQYNLAVYNDDSAIMVNYKQDYSSFSPAIPMVLDSLFTSEFVDSIAIYAPSDSINNFTIYFSQSAPYSGYVLTYDPTNYRVTNIRYYLKNVPTDEGVTSGTALVNISVTGYSTDPISQDLFWEDKFIYKQNGELFLKPAYAGYQLLDNTTTKPTQTDAN